MQSEFDVQLLPLEAASSASSAAALYVAAAMVSVAAFWAVFSIAHHQPRRLIGAGAMAVAGIALWAVAATVGPDPITPDEAVAAWASERGGVVSADGSTIELPDGCVVTARVTGDDAERVLLRSDAGCLDA